MNCRGEFKNKSETIQKKAFENGEIDLLAQTINNVLSLDGIAIAAKIGEDPFYLAISKTRSDLLAELNAIKI